MKNNVTYTDITQSLKEKTKKYGNNFKQVWKVHFCDLRAC